MKHTPRKISFPERVQQTLVGNIWAIALGIYIVLLIWYFGTGNSRCNGTEITGWSNGHMTYLCLDHPTELR